MSDLPALLAVFGGFAAVLAGFVWLAVHVRRRGTAGSAVTAALASWEEAYRVTSHASYWEIKAQEERRAPVLSPDGHWRPSGGPGTGRVGGRSRAALPPRPRHHRAGLRRPARRWRRRH
ncbi:hypothetical protein [Streptomyces luteireticuli]|uniref:Secreted protein n=1 Tax=Streptomyces luteireticuli TaxID=173858 RepID=A0ABN0YNE4_9ACTN